MENMLSKKSLLVLGSTGFLGSAVINALNSKRVEGWERIVSQNSPPGSPLLFHSIHSNYTHEKVRLTPISTNNLNSDLVVINCASSRNSNSKELSQQSNFAFPKRVLESLLANKDLQILWIQIETFWQYSKFPVPDVDYVFWKNQFKTILEESSLNNSLRIYSLTLPHLVGPYDNPDRFFPRTFTKMLKSELVTVNSPDEVFSLADVRDVAEYLARALNDIFTSKIPNSNLFPFFELTLREIINRFLTISNSDSQIRIIKNSKKSNPSMILSNQPPLLVSDQQLLRNIDTTLTDIFQWLSKHHKIDSLD